MARKRKRTKEQRDRAAKRRDPRPSGGSDLSVAVASLQAGRMDETRQICEVLIRANPSHARAWHLMGLASLQLGDVEIAAEQIGRATQLRPDDAPAYNDLGNVLCELSQYSAAETAYRRGIELAGSDSKLHSNLGSVLRQLGRSNEAIERCRQAIELAPDNVSAHYYLARAMSDCGRFDEAADCFQRVLALDPEHDGIHGQLCGALSRAGRHDEARQACDRWLEREPDNPVARHLRAALSGSEAPYRASDAYVQQVFDQFAARYDSDLQQLGYQGHQILATTLATRFGQPRAEYDILDAGCGTGLCAAALRPYARSLVGVDLSPEMLARAKQQQIYDELNVAEITGYLQTRLEGFDVIVACDTFNYFGDLGPLLNAVAAALRPSGSLIFTVERRHGESSRSIQLNTTGRYSHAQDYVEAALSASRLAVDSVSIVQLRREAGQPVEAMLVQARRISRESDSTTSSQGE